MIDIPPMPPRHVRHRFKPHRNGTCWEDLEQTAHRGYIVLLGDMGHAVRARFLLQCHTLQGAVMKLQGACTCWVPQSVPIKLPAIQKAVKSSWSLFQRRLTHNFSHERIRGGQQYGGRLTVAVAVTRCSP